MPARTALKGKSPTFVEGLQSYGVVQIQRLKAKGYGNLGELARGAVLGSIRTEPAAFLRDYGIILLKKHQNQLVERLEVSCVSRVDSR